MSAGDSILILHAGAAWFMCGLIWFVQVVHYPLMEGVGREGWIAYERAHTRLTTWVVGPAMLSELALAALVIAVGGAEVGRLAWAGAVLLALVWASTFFVQVPLHRRLGRGFEPGAHRALVRTNWVRTAGWTARGVLALVMLA